jgi:anti-sigma regulatory factor (Ser/Thr protein kinase)
MSAPAPLQLTLANDLAEIPRAAAAFEAWAEPLDAPMADLMALQLALEETITNIIHHGHRDQPTGTRSFTVEFSVPGSAGFQPASETRSAQAPRIRLTLTDDAPAYDPLARAEVDTSAPLEDRPIGGLGVHLVKKLMTHAAYERRGPHNILTLERVLGTPSAS